MKLHEAIFIVHFSKLALPQVPSARESSGPIRFRAVIRAPVYGMCSFPTVTELQTANWNYSLNA